MATNKLFNAIYKPQSNFTYTENGAVTYKSTKSKVLDLFSRGAAMRSGGLTSEKDILNIFTPAFNENAALAIATLFYIRDIPRAGKGGQGERNFFRVAFRFIANSYPDMAKAVLNFIPEYARWDDILHATRGTSVYEHALDAYGTQLVDDALALSQGKDSISLAAKWAPSERAGKLSSTMSKELREYMGLSAKRYRMLISKLREHLKLVETLMSSRLWSHIDYSRVPSKAMKMYRKAFRKHDSGRFGAFIDSVLKGEKKINAATLYPYEIVKDLVDGYGYYKPGFDEKTLDALWKALPNYLEGKALNSLVVVDVSGSMSGDPMAVSMSLGLYVAERNEHPLWKDHFITFSAKPELQKISGKSLAEKLRSIRNNGGYNTDLQAVFDLILSKAQKAKLSQADMPETIYIVSDMEFDQIEDDNGWYSSNTSKPSKKKTNLQAIRDKYAKAGYAMPNIVFWNVRAANMQSPATFDENNVAMFAGLSPTIFLSALGGTFDPLSVMLETITSERYAPIVKAIAPLMF